MKKLFTLLCMVVFTMTSIASYAQVKLGIQAGLNVNSVGYNFEDPDNQDEADDEEDEARDATKPRLGYRVGIAAEYGFSEGLALQTGLFLSNKGTRIEVEGSEEIMGTVVNYSSKAKLSLTYLEIPVNLAYKISNFQIHAGPYVGIGLFGQVEGESTLNGQTEEQELKYIFRNKVSESDYDDLGEDETFARRLDLGVNAGIGYKVGPVLVTGTYFRGFSSLDPKEEDNDNDEAEYKTFNNVFTLAFTWFFN